MRFSKKPWTWNVLYKCCKVVVAGCRVLMGPNGAQPKASLFEDPAQRSNEASSAAVAVQTGCLPAMATGNEFEAATFLKKTELSQLLRKARSGVLRTWHRIQASRELGFWDILHCMWSARQNVLGISGYFVGRMTQAGLITQRFAGGEHCCCSCGQWSTRSNFKSHSCEHVGKPHDSKLKLFWQNRGILAFRTSFQAPFQSIGDRFDIGGKFGVSHPVPPLVRFLVLPGSMQLAFMR